MTTCVYCVASTETKANDILADLKSSGLAEAEVSVLRPEKVISQFPARSKPGRSGDDSNSPASTRLVAALGISETEASRFHGKLQSGNTLIAAHPENSDHLKTARDIFQKAGATDIGQGDNSASQAAPKAPEAMKTANETAGAPVPTPTSTQSTTPASQPATAPQREASRS